MIITRTPVKWEGSYPDIAIKQGYNKIEEKFWIQVTDRRKGITIRGYMDEEYYQNFHNMGNYIFKQHSEVDPDTEFVPQPDIKIAERFLAPDKFKVDPDDEMKGFVSVP